MRFDTSLLVLARDKIIQGLEGVAVKAALSRFLKAGFMSGFRGWLIKFIVTELLDEIAWPAIRLVFRKFGLLVNVSAGKITLQKIEAAERSRNERDYMDHIGDV